MIQCIFRLGDCPRVLTANVTLDRIATAFAPMRITCCATNREHMRMPHEFRREVVVEKSAAPARNRGRLLLHAAATDVTATSPAG